MEPIAVGKRGAIYGLGDDTRENGRKHEEKKELEAKLRHLGRAVALESQKVQEAQVRQQRRLEKETR